MKLWPRVLAAGVLMALPSFALASASLAQQPAPAPAASAAQTPATAAQPPKFEANLMPDPRVLLPKGAPSEVVFLLSDISGWQADDQTVADRLTEAGAAVVAVDLRTWLKAAEDDTDPKDPDDCAYLTADIEDLSHQIQRAAGASTYHLPIIAGRGAGGALALGIVAQSPYATVGRTVVVDPAAEVPTRTVLCTQAPKRPGPAGGMIYGLQKGPLPDPVDVSFTPAADAAGKAHVAEITGAGFALAVKPVSGTAVATLGDGVLAAIALTDKPVSGRELSDLPLVEVPALPKAPAARGVMAIIFSGDGGWRDLDRQIGDILAGDGVPVVGIDALKYFWSEKTPAQIATDLSRIIGIYTNRWNVRQVVIAGYSFGADVIPASYNQLARRDKNRVLQLSLLGPSPNADFVFRVTNWLSPLGIGISTDHPTLPELKQIEPAKIQCFYGEDDKESVCPKLTGTGVELIQTTGSHHFDGDYPKLAQRILDGVTLRQKSAAAGSPPPAP